MKMNTDIAFTLYSTKACPFTARIKVLIAIKALEVPVIDPSEIGFDKYEKIVSPIRIPAIQLPDGKVLVESEAICEFIEEQFPDKPGVQDDPLERYRLRLISRRGDLDLASSLSPIATLQKLETRDERIIKMIQESGTKALSALNSLLSERAPFAMGESLSHVDGVLLTRLHLIEQMWSLYDVGNPFTNFPRIREYREALSDNEVMSAIEKPYLEALLEGVADMRAKHEEAAACSL